MLPDLTLLNQIFISLLTDLAERFFPLAKNLKVLVPSLELNSSSHFSLVDEDIIFTTITLKEEVSEINKQNQLISVDRKERIHRYY